jgi:hypothetical protein
MLIISLILYLLLAIVFILPGIAYVFSIQWYHFLILFAICIGFVKISFSLVRNYQDSYIPIIRELANSSGVKTSIVFSFFTAIVLLVIWGLTGTLTVFKAVIIIPLLAIAGLNMMGYEYFPKYIHNYKHAKNWLIPESLTNYDETKSVPSKYSDDFSDMYDFCKKNFSWNHKGDTYSFELHIRPLQYQKYKEIQRLSHQYWVMEYVLNGTCGEIEEVAFKLMQFGKPANSFQEVEFVLSFIYLIVKYVDNDEHRRVEANEQNEYPKYPLESLAEESADYKDSAILAATILSVMGYNVAIFYIPGHTGIGIAGVEDMPGSLVKFNHTDYCFCKESESGWEVGVVPPESLDGSLRVLPIQDHDI